MGGGGFARWDGGRRGRAEAATELYIDGSLVYLHNGGEDLVCCHTRYMYLSGRGAEGVIADIS
jgi:hypothetical protein